MVLLEKMREAEIYKYDQVIGFCKDHHIKPAFEAKHATVTFIEKAMDANQPDYLIYVVDASATTPNISLLGKKAQSACTIVVVNKM